MSVMTTLRTVAKMGRSMKKRDSMASGPLLFGASILARVLVPGRGGPAAAGVFRSLLGDRRRRRPQRGHGASLRLDLRVRPDLLEPADEDAVVRRQPLDDLAQAVVLERPGRDPAVLDLVVLIDDVDELCPLVGADGPIDDQER